jgi:hypothetical protein
VIRRLPGVRRPLRSSSHRHFGTGSSQRSPVLSRVRELPGSRVAVQIARMFAPREQVIASKRPEPVVTGAYAWARLTGASSGHSGGPYSAPVPPPEGYAPQFLGKIGANEGILFAPREHTRDRSLVHGEFRSRSTVCAFRLGSAPRRPLPPPALPRRRPCRPPLLPAVSCPPSREERPGPIPG